MRPMKGTRPPITSAELGVSAKDRAENLMIVDMVRHDLGSFADVGSVQVSRLFSVEKYRTSTIEARSSISTSEVLSKILPASSITGAPKISAANEIAKLERSPRNVYCGTIGLMWPGQNARFSVAIRTALMDRHGRGEYGVGSGIVWDSDPADEYRECLLKAEVLKKPAPQWHLLESIGRQAFQEPALVEGHVARMVRAADELGIVIRPSELRRQILEHTLGLDGPAKLRVTLSMGGSLSFQQGESRFGIEKPKTVLARSPISSQNMDSRYKSTSRAIYEAHIDQNPGFDDVLLYNEHGNVTG